MAIHADGKIVAAGYVLIGSLFDFGLARYNTDGSLDTTFDGDGKVTTDFGDSEDARGVAIQADGKIVAAGSTLGDFALARYNTDGSLDTTFGSDGKVTTDFGDGDSARGIAIRGDRRLVAVGSALGDFAVARYVDPLLSTRGSELPWAIRLGYFSSLSLTTD